MAGDDAVDVANALTSSSALLAWDGLPLGVWRHCTTNGGILLLQTLGCSVPTATAGATGKYADVCRANSQFALAVTGVTKREIDRLRVPRQ
jgi:hypothetical protein